MNDGEDDHRDVGLENVNDLITEAKRLKASLANKLESVRRDQKRISSLHQRIAYLKLGDAMLAPTDHAVVRYLGRVKGVDIDAIREEIRSAASEACAGFNPSNKMVIVEGGLTFVFGEKGTIASIWPSDSPPPPGTKADDKDVVRVAKRQ